MLMDRQYFTDNLPQDTLGPKALRLMARYTTLVEEYREHVEALRAEWDQTIPSTHSWHFILLAPTSLIMC